MTGNHRWFSSLTPVSSSEHIIFGDKGTGKVRGVSAVSVSESFILRDVDLIGNLGYNLLSVSQLLEKGYEVRFKKGFSRVLDARESLVCPVLPFGKVFRADFSSSFGPSRWLVAGPSSDLWKWHRKLGHLSFDLLAKLSSLDLIRGLPKLKSERDLVCHPCRYGKMNGVVECKNRTLVEMARTMLDEHRTLRKFWAETINTACYVSNRIFLRLVLNKTSYELRFGWQPKVSHLRVFGCRCFVLKQGNLDKFEPRSSDGVFLDYATHSRAYRIWLLDSGRIVETCEVTFDETMPCTTPSFELEGDDEIGTTIFEDDEEDVGVSGNTALAAAPKPAASLSEDDEGAPVHSPSTTWEQPPLDPPVHAAGPAEDVGEVTTEPQPSRMVQRDHPSRNIIGGLNERVTRSRSTSIAHFAHSAFVASFEPHDVGNALSDPNWVNAMHEELENFERNQVWVLVEPPPHCNPIGTKWVFKNKQGEDGVVIRQTPHGTFVHQSKYTRDLLRKFEMADASPQMTPMSTSTALDADEDGKEVDQKVYRGMIGSLLYLTATRPDIQFTVGVPEGITPHRCQADLEVVDVGVDKALIKGEIEVFKCTESGLSSWL
ncbi:hypothetical protein U9M48_027048 [Paspalum notatum var. saurae]|uniref:Gag-pol polyprotein n=1 Tax=Paspalum notatum var. saurae TaxID=547442 RepID=A0AAQ3TU39_PASNO